MLGCYTQNEAKTEGAVVSVCVVLVALRITNRSQSKRRNSECSNSSLCMVLKSQNEARTEGRVVSVVLVVMTWYWNHKIKPFRDKSMNT